MGTTYRHLASSAALVALFSFAAGCAAQDESAPTDSIDSELASNTRIDLQPSDVVGSIDIDGEAEVEKEIVYPGTSRYRALSFHLNPLESGLRHFVQFTTELRGSSREQERKIRVFVVDSQFKVLASEKGTTDLGSLKLLTLVGAGDYYFVFRTDDLGAGKFRIRGTDFGDSMGHGENRPDDPPPNNSTPWTCGGPLLSDSALLSRIEAGTTQLSLGNIGIEGRYRDCSTATGCSAWKAPSGDGRTNLGAGAYHSNNRIVRGLLRTTQAGELSLVSVSYNSPSREIAVSISNGSARGTSAYADHTWADGYDSAFVETGIEAEFANGCGAIRLAKESVTLSDGTTREWEFGARFSLPGAVR